MNAAIEEHKCDDEKLEVYLDQAADSDEWRVVIDSDQFGAGPLELHPHCAAAFAHLILEAANGLTMLQECGLGNEAIERALTTRAAIQDAADEAEAMQEEPN